MTITEPDGKIRDAEPQKNPVTRDGYYVNFIQINYKEPGQYSVSVYLPTGSKILAKHIGTVTFNVVEKSTGSFTPQPEPIISSVRTDVSSYSKGDTIKISGSIKNYDSLSWFTVDTVWENCPSDVGWI